MARPARIVEDCRRPGRTPGSPAANHYLDGMQTYHHVRNRVCDGFLGDGLRRERVDEGIRWRRDCVAPGMRRGDKAQAPVYWHTNGR